MHQPIHSSAAPLSPRNPSPGARLQRKCACGGTPGPTGECESCRKKREQKLLQRSALVSAGAHRDAAEAPASVHEVLRSPGRPLDAATRAFMEPRFGHDFSQVRVHTDAQAGESARALNAHAYTVGKDVAFGTGNYAPGTQPGRQLLAHELTHVVQQDGNNPGTRAKSKIEIGSPNDSMEHEADAIAASVTSPPAANQPANSPPVQSATPPLLQRKLLINPADTVPLPGGKQTPLTVAIKSLLDDTCPDGNFQVDATGNVAPETAQFCQQPPPPPPRFAADVSSTPAGCGCICEVINNTKTTTVAFRAGDPGTSPRSEPVAAPGQGGVPADPTVLVNPTFRGQYLIDGRWVDIPFHLIFAHELCGHALPKMKGTHVARGQRPEGGTAPEERQAVDVERKIAAEHNPPLPQRPEDYAGGVREAPPNTAAGDALIESASPFLASALGSATLSNFDTGKSTLKPEHKTQLATTAHAIEVLLRKYAASTITIVGHADTVGTEAKNLQLGQERADVVKNELSGLGVSGSSMTAESKGESDPQPVKTKDETPNALNRRVEVVFHPKASPVGLMTPKLKPPSVGNPPGDEFSPVEKPPIDLNYHPKIEPPDPTKLPPDIFKPIPPAPKGSGPKSALDVLGEKILDPIIDSVAGGLSKDLRDKIKEGARDAVKSGVAKGARAAAESAGLKDPAGLDAIEKAAEAAIQEKGKSPP